MKSGTKYPSNYIKASSYEDTGIISTVDEMTKFIHDNYIIDSIIEQVNDSDYEWNYNTPEKFSKACVALFKKKLGKLVKERGFKVKGLVLDLVSDDIINELIEKASSGDFDEDDSNSTSETNPELDRIFEEQCKAIDEACAKYPKGDKRNAAIDKIAKKYAKKLKDAGF